MKARSGNLGRYGVLALIACGGLAIETAPTLIVPARDHCPALAETIAASSCAALAYGDAQRIGGDSIRPAAAPDAGCAATANVL